jgi:hypothetical protein
MEHDPFNPAPRKSLVQRFQEKLAASRFLTFSLLLHVVLVVMGGSVVLFKQYVAPPDFAPDGPLVGSETAVRPPEPEVVQVTETLTQTQPNISAPTVSAIVSTTTQASSYQLVSAPMPIVKSLGEAKLGELPKATAVGIAKGLPATMAGRAGGTARAAAMKMSGGKDASEKAVMAGLRWLKQNQKEDGSWGANHVSAMTGLGVLCFLGHGETPEAPEFGPTVKKGVDWLLKKGNEFDGRMSLTKGQFPSHGGVYEHAIATYAMCEYYSMTKDERLVGLVKKAVTHIVEGQAPDGGWQYAYAKGIDSDTSVSGWQIQALKAAHLTQLNIPGVDEALDKAMLNLKRVQGPKGGFGYRKAEDRYSLTGVGVLCTYFWKQDKDKVVKDGIEFLLKQAEDTYRVKYKGDHADLYAWYYHTQACLMYGGSAWSKWNRMFQDEIASSQSPDGSWPIVGGKGGAGGLEVSAGGSGPVYRTALCVLMLEVFYRYMPTNK